MIGNLRDNRRFRFEGNQIQMKEAKMEFMNVTEHNLINTEVNKSTEKIRAIGPNPIRL